MRLRILISLIPSRKISFRSSHEPDTYQKAGDHRIEPFRVSGLSYGSSLSDHSSLSAVPKLSQAKPATYVDVPRGFTNTKEFEYSFKKSSVENIKPTSSRPYGNPQLANLNPQATEDLDKKINWFKSENARMEHRSDNAVLPRSDYLRLEENRMDTMNDPNPSRKPTMPRGTSRDASILSSVNILNELPPLSEIRNPGYTGDSKSEMGNLESLSQNCFNIPQAPKLASISTQDQWHTSNHSVAPPGPANPQTNHSRTPTVPTLNSPQGTHNIALSTAQQQPNSITVPTAAQILSQPHDAERQRLQALVEAQTKLIADMQAQLQRERFKASLPRTTNTTTTASRESPNRVSQSSLDSMFQTYLARQTDWTAIRRGLGVSTPGSRMHDTLTHQNKDADSKSFLRRSQEAQTIVVDATMQPKIQAIELKRKKSIRSTSTSRLSIKSGMSVTKKPSNSALKNLRKEKSAEPRVRITQNQRVPKKSKSRGTNRPPIAHLEPETLALLGAALQKNKAKTRMFVEKLKALVAEVVGDSSKRKRSITRSKSRERLVKPTKKREEVCTLESLSHVISSQRSHGSAEKKRKRVK